MIKNLDRGRRLEDRVTELESKVKALSEAVIKVGDYAFKVVETVNENLKKLNQKPRQEIPEVKPFQIITPKKENSLSLRGNIMKELRELFDNRKKSIQ